MKKCQDAGVPGQVSKLLSSKKAELKKNVRLDQIFGTWLFRWSTSLRETHSALLV